MGQNDSKKLQENSYIWREKYLGHIKHTFDIYNTEHGNNIFYLRFFFMGSSLLCFCFHIQVSVSDSYIPRIDTHIWLQQNRQTDPGKIYKSRTDI
jgi:hypothetical protein